MAAENSGDNRPDSRTEVPSKSSRPIEVKPLPEILEIQPLTKPPNCTITVPGSKSITNRALILAALSTGKRTLRRALWADDTQVMVNALKELGFKVIHSEPDADSNCTIEIEGHGGKIPAKKAELYVGNAGTAARFLTAFVSLGHGEYTIRGDARMNERPMKDLFDALGTLDAKIESTGDHLPATIRTSGLSGREIVISSETSSQFASALLLILKHVPGLRVTILRAPEAHGYVAMTERLLIDFDFTSPHADYSVEPDTSSGSYFVAVDFLFSKAGGRVEVLDWPNYAYPWLQVDSQFPQFLPPPMEPVSRAIHLGDSVMTLAICTLFGRNELVIKDAARMRLQETDRIKAMVTELRRVGAKSEEHVDGFTVWPAGEGQLHGADIETYNDHRIAMCFAVLGLKVPGIRIKNPGCVSKTFPNFFDKLEQLRR
jgi:3-phosphoshikimate 1-carboxyvinyltransferase